MQLKTTEGPSQGSLPPRVAEPPPSPRSEPVNKAKKQTLLRHRCPLSCSHSHAHPHSRTHTHPTKEGSNGTDDTHPQPYHYSSRHHYPHYEPYQPTPPQPTTPFHNQFQGGQSTNMISRGGLGGGSGVSGGMDTRVPPLSLPYRVSGSQTKTINQVPFVPLDYRRKAIKYMSTRLQVGVNVEEEHSVREIERRIQTLEEQVYESSVTQDEYVSKLASRLAAILQHLDKCRSPRTPPVAHQSQQEPVM